MINVCDRYGRVRQIKKTVQGPQKGYQDLFTYPTVMTGSVVPALANATYDLDIQLDGEAWDALTVALLATDDWDGIAAKIQVVVRAAGDGTELVAIQTNGAMRFTSAKTGLTSSIYVVAGTTGSGGGDLLAAIDGVTGYTTSLGAAAAGTEGDINKAGYASISSSGTVTAGFVGTTACSLPNATYDLDVAEDGNPNNAMAIALLAADTWDEAVAKIQVVLRAATGTLEDVVIQDGKIVIYSATTGASSGIVIVAGTTGSGGGDLLAAIDAIVVPAAGAYVNALDTPVDGTEGTISINCGIPRGKFDTLATMVEVRSTLGVQKTNTFTIVENDTTGYVSITESGASSFADGDEVMLQVWHYKAGTTTS